MISGPTAGMPTVHRCHVWQSRQECHAEGPPPAGASATEAYAFYRRSSAGRGRTSRRTHTRTDAQESLRAAGEDLAQREWLQQLKEALISMDFPTMHVLLESAGTVADSSGNVLDGHQQRDAGSGAAGNEGEPSEGALDVDGGGPAAMQSDDIIPSRTTRVCCAFLLYCPDIRSQLYVMLGACCHLWCCVSASEIDVRVACAVALWLQILQQSEGSAARMAAHRASSRRTSLVQPCAWNTACAVCNSGARGSF